MLIFGKKRKKYGQFKYSDYGRRSGFGVTRSRRHFSIKIFIAIFFMVYAIYIVFFSGYLEFRDISIDNNTSLEENTLRNSINSKLSSKIFGIIPSNNILLFDNDGMVSYLKENNPTIESVTITRKSYNTISFLFNEKKSLLIWCRLNDCFYLDDDAVAFENTRNRLIMEIAPIKIYEQSAIEEEAEDNTAMNNEKNPDVPLLTEQEINIEPKILPPININDKVSDNEFVDFLIELNRLLSKSNYVKIKYYKTKGPNTREIIAYTDKNIRLYFDSSISPLSQVNYLNAFLEQGVENVKIDKIRYIYLKSDNKIFFK